MKLRLVVEIEMTDRQMADYDYEYGQGSTEPEVAEDVTSQVDNALKSGPLADFATIRVTRR